MIVATDQIGRELTLPQAPSRMVSLCPSTTETLFALGVGDRVVGRTKFCTRPIGAVESAVSVGGTKAISVDRLGALEPDLVVSVREENEREQVEEIAERWPTLVLDPVSVDSAVAGVRLLGQVTGEAACGEATAAEIEKAFGSLPDIRSLRVLYLIWRRPYMAVGAGTYIDDVLRKLGMVNMAATLEGRYPEIDDPTGLRVDAVLASSEPFPFDAKHVDELEKWCPKSSVHLVDGEAFGWHGVRMIDAAGVLRSTAERLIRAAGMRC